MANGILKFAVPQNQKKAKTSRRNKAPKVTSGFGGWTNNPRSDTIRQSFSKVIDKGVITSTSAADGLYAEYFTLNDLSEVSSFTSIFDQYRISRIDLMLMAVTQPSTTAVTSPGYAFCAVVNDFDDANALSSFSLALNYQNVSVLAPGLGHNRSIVPHVNLEANASSQVISKQAPWIDCSDPSVQHYGFKYAVKQSTSTFVSSWYRFYRVHVEFRMVR